MLNLQRLGLLAHRRSRALLASFSARFGDIERTTLVALIAAALVVLGLTSLAGAVARGSTLAFDEWLLLALRSSADAATPIGPRWLREMMRDFTAMGGTGVLTLMVLAVAGFLATIRKLHAASMVIASTFGGMLVSQLLKWSFARPRPRLVPYGSETFTASFPSGHSMMSAVVYLTLGALLARTQPDRHVKAYVMTVAVVLTALVGTSRVYLGVHWLTDVLAGWALGGLWALLCWTVMLRLQRHGQVEPETNAGARSGA
jgi:undecaprenyl-diphosphatase